MGVSHCLVSACALLFLGVFPADADDSDREDESSVKGLAKAIQAAAKKADKAEVKDAPLSFSAWAAAFQV